MPQLDGLRAVAVLAVVAHHTVPWCEDVQLGTMGVYLFFVLSGYLITGILLRARYDCQSAGTPRLTAVRQFYIRRFLRIFPLFYVAIIACAAFGLLGPGAWKWHALYLTNHYIIHRGDWVGATSHFWSLAVEEQFYLLWPWLIMFWPMKSLARMVVACITIGLVWKPAAYVMLGSKLPSFLPMPSCMDTLGCGALLAMMSLRQRRWPGSIGVVGSVFGLYAIGCSIASRTAFDRSFAIAVFATLSGPWVVDRAAAGFGGSIGRFLSSKLIVSIGAISYGIYVWHGPVYAIAARWHLTSTPALAFLVTATGSLSLAGVSWMLYERPINSLKRFFPYAPSDKHLAAKPPEPPPAACICAPFGSGLIVERDQSG
jgi:peptidoglycan/LPS O-acetylase OafA/YrhL